MGFDWIEAYQETPERIAEQVLRQVQNGDIIVLHDGYDKAVPFFREGTVAAVPLIIAGLKERNLSPVTVSELLMAKDWTRPDETEAAE